MNKIYACLNMVTLSICITSSPVIIASAAAQTTDEPLLNEASAVLLPVAEAQNNITYITGGIGDEDTHMLQHAKSDYNLYITSSGPQGMYEGNATISIQDRDGHTLLNVDAGPLFYAQLPAGVYTVKVTSNGQTITRQVIMKHHAKANLNLRFTS